MDELTFKSGEHLSHAYIVSSQAEDVRNKLADRLAAALVCSGSGTVPCGVCRDCRKAFGGIHPDIITIERQTDDKGNKKREIYVDQVRYMVGDACVMANEARRKVYIVRDADTMNPSAQNAALKLLEEPPSAAAFILCAANPGELLPTVRSRCEEINRNSQPDEHDEEADALAAEFIKTAAAGSDVKMLTWCLGHEDMDTRHALAFIRAARAKLTDMLCRRGPDMGMKRKQMMELTELLDSCQGYLEVNTGVKHLMGLLAVDAVRHGKDNK